MTSAMNYLILNCLLLFLTNNVCSQDSESCDLRLTDLERNKVDMNSYCRENPCVVKCCAKNEVFHVNGSRIICKNIEVLKKDYEELGYNMKGLHFDYSNMHIYNDDNYDELASKKFKDFTLLYSELFMGKNTTGCAIWQTKRSLKLSEKGTLLIPMRNHYDYWTRAPTPDFCVDIAVVTKPSKVLTKIYYRLKGKNEKQLESKLIFNAIGMLISVFFLLLVLVVYSILPLLRNMQGMLLYAYVATLMGCYVFKSWLILVSLVELYSGQKESSDCTLKTQIIYFMFLASFFWLKIMSFDIWWTFRGSRKIRAIHRRGIYLKMIIYASYAYGVPAAMTIFAVIMDSKDLPPHIVKPMFNTCFASDTYFVYLHVPLMILTGCNCWLFLMTTYNIWLIKRNIACFDNATAKKNDFNRNTLMMYIKLSSLMGVSWIIDLSQTRVLDESIPVWLFLLLNAYNALTGVVIFFLFVFKKKIFVMLCKRFKIENWAHRHFKLNASTRADLSKGSKSYSTTHSRSRTNETDRKEDCIALKRIDRELIDPNPTGTDV